MSILSRLAAALGLLVTGLVALSGEVHLSHPLHQLAIVVGAVVLLLIHPQEGAGEALATVEAGPRPESAIKPDASSPV